MQFYTGQSIGKSPNILQTPSSRQVTIDWRVSSSVALQYRN